MKQGTTYEISFRIRAESARRLAFGINSHDYHNLGLFEEINAGPAWQEMRYRMVPVSTDHDAELHFDVGASTVGVELTDIVLRRLPEGVPVQSGAPLP